MAEFRPLTKFPWVIQSLLWTLLIVLLFYTIDLDQRRKILDLAEIQADASYKNDQAYRSWAASHGGLYVPVTADTPPNPYLEVPERDVRTTSGHQLTLINPEYMSRQAHELAEQYFDIRGHLTSLKPLRPENRADPWEQTALRQLETGPTTKVVEQVVLDGQPFLRAMYPLVTEQSCLVCHRKQGYQLGDIRGGVSISVPMAPYLASYRDSRSSNLVKLTVLWLFGLLGQFWAFGAVRRQFLELKTTHRDLLQSQVRYHDLFNEADYGIAIIDPLEERILECNRSLAEFLDTTPERLTGQPATVLPGTRDLTTSVYSREIEISRQEREDLIIEVKKRLIELDGRTAEEIFFYDRTRERKQEREQLAAAQHIQDIFAAAQNVAFVIAAAQDEAPIIEFSPGAENIFHYSKAEILGKPVRILHPADVNISLLQSKMRRGEIAFSGRTRMVRKSGASFPALLTIYPLHDAKGELYGGLGVSIDLSEMSELEERLRQTQKLEAIGTLAGGIAHDFNNILGIIFGNLQLAMRRSDEDENIRKRLKTIEEAAVRAKELVDQILIFSRRRGEHKQSLLIRPVIKEAIKLLRPSLPKTIEIREEVAAEQVRVLADPVQIHQVLVNLCTNAFQAMANNGGILEIKLAPVIIDRQFADKNPDLKPGDYLLLEVSDDGEGITEENLPRIFDPFFTTREDQGGTGLGLAVIHGIVRDHNGAILVASSPGQGTTVSIYLPVSHLQGTSAASDQQPFDNSAEGSERILLIDDEPLLAAVGRDLLKALGYQVKVATSSGKALELFRADPDRFDLVVTDQTMPELTGDKLTAELLKLRPELPVIICTGYSDLLDQNNVRQCGAKKLLKKPLKQDLLGRTIREVLDGI